MKKKKGGLLAELQSVFMFNASHCNMKLLYNPVEHEFIACHFLSLQEETEEDTQVLS